MNNFSKILTSVVLGIFLISGFSSCSQDSQKEAVKQGEPKSYDAELLTSYQEGMSKGYEFMEAGEPDSAAAAFTAAGLLVPEGKYNEYNLACVYGSTGETDKAFEWLQKMADKGWDIPDQLYEDTDFSSLLDDPRFEKIVEQCRNNATANEESYTNGLPEYDVAPMQFATQDEFDEWASEESQNLRSHGRIWYSSQSMAANLDFSAKKLACLRDLKKDDSTFDYGLERVRAVAKIKSPYESWGSFTKVVIKEVDNYLASSPEKEAANEALFKGGLAYSLQYGIDDDAMTSRDTALNNSNTYLAKVEEGTEFYFAAKTVEVANKLDLSPDNKEQYREDVRKTLNASLHNKWVNRIVATRFHDFAIKSLWPIELHLKDIDGKAIKLDEYKGKALLIDFWATWCPPCRAELPNLLEIYKEYHSQGFEIVSISLDYEDKKPLDEYRTWIDENEMTWRHIYDGKGWDAELVDYYYISSIPATFMVDTEGNIIASGDDCRGENLEKSVKMALGI